MIREQNKKPHRRKPVGTATKNILADPLESAGLPIALAATALEIIAFLTLMGWL